MRLPRDPVYDHYTRDRTADKIDRVLCEMGEQVREGAELLVFVDQ